MATKLKVVVVGAGSGIGAATAELLHDRGHHVVAVDLRQGEARAAERRVCDLRDPASIQDLVESLGDGWDVLAHVAGLPGTAPALDVLTVNYLGFRLMAEGLLPRMSRGGAIVGVASTAGIAWPNRIAALSGLLSATDADAIAEWQATQDPAYPVYSTSKEAAIIYARQLAATAWEEYGVRVNTVSPGPVHTPILEDFEATMGKDTLDYVRSTVGRHGDVNDIAPVIAFLSSPEARWVNGQDIQVDGGFITGVAVQMAAAGA
ncbi:short-chain dehydrogenase [Mycobacterium sp. E802]|uniref:coniferyl-alcohol dehydrogenase n=1 Tax=Mycobacterium sp. E802 TaxID=1834152 RepID=UPI0007FDDC76|nr:coniferyl-alcohol dehydrogenase [Mycobacterium sp. E802]OBG88796.1 short-chain dehydrogenase [Mycobacterium sp. E802]